MPNLIDNLASRGRAVQALAGQATQLGAAAGQTLGAASSAASASFHSFLSQAKLGNLTSGLPVTVSPRANLNLSPDQLARLGPAADKAASAGLTSALVIIDGQTLQLDVHTRQITAAVDATQRALTGVEGVINVPTEEQVAAGVQCQLVPLPRLGVDNASVLAAIANAPAGTQRPAA